MKRISIAMVLVTTPLFGGGVGAGDAARKELQRLQGTWKVLKAQRSWDPTSTRNVNKHPVIISGDKITFTHRDEKRGDVAAITLDSRMKPAAIDLRPGRGKVVLKGIYKLEKDKLTICIAVEPDAPRPMEFTSTKKPKTSLLVLERVKK